MENNCLVTKLKANVNDNSLLKIGEMFIDIIEQESPTNQTNRLYLNTSNTSDLVIEVENGEANLTLDENMASGWTNKITLPKSVSAPAPVYVRNGNYRVKVSSKYDLTEVGRWTSNSNQTAIVVKTDYLKYSKNMITIDAVLNGKMDDIASLTKIRVLLIRPESNINEGNLYSLRNMTEMVNLALSTNITGDISSLSNMTKLQYLSLKNLDHTGDISSFSNMTKLSQVYISSIKVTVNINNMTQPLTEIICGKLNGEIIEFVKTQRASGRTTGSCKFATSIGGLTFNGVVISGPQNVTWTDNTINSNGVIVEQ